MLVYGRNEFYEFGGPALSSLRGLRGQGVRRPAGACGDATTIGRLLPDWFANDGCRVMGDKGAYTYLGAQARQLRGGKNT